MALTLGAWPDSQVKNPRNALVYGKAREQCFSALGPCPSHSRGCLGGLVSCAALPVGSWGHHEVSRSVPICILYVERWVMTAEPSHGEIGKSRTFAIISHPDAGTTT